MSTELSNAPTLTPSDSASQAVQPAAAQKSRGQGKRKNPKAPKDASAPPGAVDVPAPGQNKTGKKSAVVSAAVPISGWGETDLHEFRRDIRPEFTVDANPYEDLVITVYGSLQSRFSAPSKHIPRALFIYYCMNLWHLRSLYLHKGNANVLTQAEKQAFNVLSSGEEYMVPAPIAQYLANMGNFQQGGETYYYRRNCLDYTGVWENGNVVKGWVPTEAGIQVDSARTFWEYASSPVPAVYTQAVQMEANHTLPAPFQRQTLNHIAPDNRGAHVSPTDNIIGWSNHDYDAHHSSWRSTFSNLGWGPNSIPRDTQTVFNISTSTMKWVSERLSTVHDLKTHSSKQLTLSLQGNPIQAYYLGTSVPLSQAPHEFVVRDNFKGTAETELCLNSRFSMDPKLLSPSFSFGYRIDRSLSLSRYIGGHPVYHDFSNFDPWVYHRDNGNRRALPTGWEAMRNQTFMFGSQAYVNVPRFGTHELRRSTALDVAVILGN